MVRRLREQTRYFGVDRHEDTLRFGHKATERVREWLASPLRLTRFLPMGWAVHDTALFCLCGDGRWRDLDFLLVENGLARTHGVGRQDFSWNAPG